jgi:hypothetical protein
MTRPAAKATRATSTQSAKVAIATALITAATTIGASLIAIIPQMHKNSALQGQVTDLRQKLDTRSIRIGGKVWTPDRKALSGVDVMVLPSELITSSGDDGGFVVSVPSGVTDGYSVVVKATDGKAWRGLMDQSFQGDIDMEECCRLRSPTYTLLPALVRSPVNLSTLSTCLWFRIRSRL